MRSTNLIAAGWDDTFFPFIPTAPVEIHDTRIIAAPFPLEGRYLQLPFAANDLARLVERNWAPYAWGWEGNAFIRTKVIGWVTSPGPVSAGDIDFTEAGETMYFNGEFTEYRCPNVAQPDFTVLPNRRIRWIEPGNPVPSVANTAPTKIYGVASGYCPVLDNGTSLEAAAMVVELSLTLTFFTQHMFRRDDKALCGIVASVSCGPIQFSSTAEPPFNFYGNDWFLLEGSSADLVGNTDSSSEAGGFSAGSLEVVDRSKTPGDNWGDVPLYRNSSEGLTSNLRLGCLQRYQPPA